MQQPVKVGVGVTTLAGYGATVVGIIGFILVQVLKVDEEQAVVIATAVWTVVSFLITQFGRYQQAKEIAKRAPVRANSTFMAGSGSGMTLISHDPKEAAEEMKREPIEAPVDENVVDPAHEERDIHEIDEQL